MNISNGRAIRQEPYICVHKGVAVDINYNFTVLTGFSGEEIIGKDIVYIMNDLLRLNKKIPSSDEITSIESCFLFNKLLDFREASIQVLADVENDVTYFIFKQRALIDINNPISFTQQLISDNFMGIAIYSAEDFTLLKASREYEKIMYERYNQRDIVGRKIYEFIHGWMDSSARRDWETVIQNKKPIVGMELPVLNHLSGLIEYFDTSIAPILDYNRVKYLVVALNDITEKVKYKQLLVKQKEQLEVIMDNMSDIIFILDKDERYIMQNKAAIKYFNIELDNLDELYKLIKCYELDGTAIPYEKMPIAYMKRGIQVLDRVVHIKAENKELYTSISATPIFDQQGNYLLGILAIRDITDYMKHNETIKAHQYALLQAEKKEKENLEKVIEMKDEFLSLISHEFKTPLTVINSALQAMDFLYKDQITDKVKTYLDKIKQNTYRQVRLVNNLLDITGANAGHIKLNMKNLNVIFITNSIVESVSLYANQKGVNMNFESDRDEKIIALDEEKYERILLNLLSNAIKFTPKDKNIKVILISKGKNVKVSVIDEGIGIPKEKHDLIFERFGQVDSSYTRQAEGSGIGLSLVKLLVNAMGGKISVDSQIGVGSCFCVELPNLVLSEELNEEALKGSIDNRLIQSIAIEFSDIYF